MKTLNEPITTLYISPTGHAKTYLDWLEYVGKASVVDELIRKGKLIKAPTI